MSTSSEGTEMAPVKFTTEKDGAYRIFHVDGAWGMVSNTRNIHLCFFVEHPPLPDKVIYAEDGKGNMRVASTSHSSSEEDNENICIVRTYQGAAVMSIEAAKAVQTVLTNFIAIAEKLDNEIISGK